MLCLVTCLRVRGVGLLFRLYDPLAGAVKIGGVDVRTCTAASVRAALGIVPQDTCMFNASILENLKYGRQDATMEQVPPRTRGLRASDT